MTISSDLPSQALGSRLGRRAGVGSVAWLSAAATTVQKVVAVAIVPLVGVTVWLALTSDHLQRPVAAAVYWSYLIAASMGVGVYWWVRRPASRFGPLLVVFGVLTWVVSWEGANAPLAFDLGVLAEGPFFVLTFYLFLAFPMGRLEPPATRWLMGVLVLGVLAFFLPWALFTPVIAGGGPLTTCLPDCPVNVLQVGTAPTVVDVAGHLETYVALVTVVAVFVVYAGRLRAASRPQRRALMAVALTSLLFLPAYFIYNFAVWILKVDPSTTSALAWGIVVTRVLLPLGFLLALVQADRFAAQALRRLLERLVARPAPEQWRDAIAHALDDPAVRLGYHDPATGRFLEPDGAELTPPAAGGGLAWVPVQRDAEPVAAMIIDESLAENPELVSAASSATVLAVVNGALEGELRASRARLLQAGHAERRRIERDLHDGAQQRLIALRIHLALAGERLARPEDRAALERLGIEVEHVIDELRDVAHGIYPQVLAHAGPAVALKRIAARMPVTVSVLDTGLARHSEALETTIYFCCLEGLQNAAKHAGPGTSVTIDLIENDGHLSFCVADDGPGFDPTTAPRGAGLTNLHERLRAVGGTLRIDARPGRGTRIVGHLPAD